MPTVDKGRLFSTPVAEDWRTQALCTALDPELFFPVGTGEAAMAQEAQAKAICHTCPSMLKCRQWAATVEPKVEGVWGGFSQADRERIHRREQRRVRSFGDGLATLGTAALVDRLVSERSR